MAGGWLAYQYFRKLLPQKAEMESLLRQYRENTGDEGGL
jgi:hypothetical protein